MSLSGDASGHQPLASDIAGPLARSNAVTPFDTAFAYTLGIEGGYSDHPADKGGATRFGITEQVARDNGYSGPMQALPIELAKAIYRKLYWDRIGLDWVAMADADIAAECFDTGVNMGIGFPVRWLQRVLNALNRLGGDFADMPVDGVAGRVTFQALAAFLKLRGQAGKQAVLAYLNALQGSRYIDLAEARQANEAFVLGWAKRLSIVSREVQANG